MMKIFAAVMTAKGTGAISTIQVFGGDAEEAIRKIFKPAGKKSQALKPGKICLGTITNGSETIDQVTIGCEGENNFAINCHGNPLIVADIMKLLAGEGAKLISAEQMRAKILSDRQNLNSIQIEAKLALTKTKTLEGAKTIANQIKAGLNRTAKSWLKMSKENHLEKIKAEAGKILQASQKANLIINGCKAVLAGPPNTGKSTLLNTLAGRQKAIVTDIKGTTRDWVSAECRVGNLLIEFFDTAGLDEELKEEIEIQAQQKAAEILQQARLVLLVLDINQPSRQLEKSLLEKLGNKNILTVLNKCDLPAVLNAAELPPTLQNTIQISARFEAAIDNLTEKIQQCLGTAGFDLKQPVCITKRQQNLLEQLIKTDSPRQAKPLITELLKGQVLV